MTCTGKSRARLYTEHDGDGWTLIDDKYGGCVSFATRQEARDALNFSRAFIARHGDLNMFSYPYTLDSPLSWPTGADPRFESDSRLSYDGASPIRQPFAAEVRTWFGSNPEEHQIWLDARSDHREL